MTHRDLELSDQDYAFLAAQEKQAQMLERTLLDIHLQSRLKRLQRETIRLKLCLEENGRHDLAAYIQTAEDSMADCLEVFSDEH